MYGRRVRIKENTPAKKNFWGKEGTVTGTIIRGELFEVTLDSEAGVKYGCYRSMLDVLDTTFHKNGISPEYDPVTHHLANNWDPDLGYADDAYADVHFRIETPAYSGNEGWKLNADRDLFNDEIASLLKAAGFQENRDKSLYCEMIRDKERLYIHPQDISGVFKKNSVGEIERILSNNKTFYVRWVDIYDDYYDIDRAEYGKYLERQEEGVKKFLLQNAKTARKHTFVSRRGLIEAAVRGFGLKLVNNAFTIRSIDGQAYAYVNGVIDKLLAGGFLVKLDTDKDDQGIRTVAKKDRNAVRLAFATTL